jgi:hypothetical protein
MAQKAEWSGGFGNSAREPRRGSEVLPVWRRSLSRGSQSRQVFATGRAMGANAKPSSTRIPKPPVFLRSPIAADCSLTGWPGRGIVRSLNGLIASPGRQSASGTFFNLFLLSPDGAAPAAFFPVVHRLVAGVVCIYHTWRCPAGPLGLADGAGGAVRQCGRSLAGAEHACTGRTGHRKRALPTP